MEDSRFEVGGVDCSGFGFVVLGFGFGWDLSTVEYWVDTANGGWGVMVVGRGEWWEGEGGGAGPAGLERAGAGGGVGAGWRARFEVRVDLPWDSSLLDDLSSEFKFILG